MVARSKEKTLTEPSPAPTIPIRGSGNVLEAEEGPPGPVTSRPAVVARACIRKGTIKSPLAVHPARDRLAALLVAEAVLLADDLDVQGAVGSGD